MKKIKKIDLSKVEHLDDVSAKEYVAQINSAEQIGFDSKSDTDNSGDSGGSGDSSGSGSTGSGTSTDPKVLPECVNKREGEACTIDGRDGICEYRKVTDGFIIKDESVVLGCIPKANESSGVGEALSRRERACVGKKYGDSCSYLQDNGSTAYQHCYYARYSFGTGILRCSEEDLRSDKDSKPL